MSSCFVELKKEISKGNLFGVKKLLETKRLPFDCVDPENGFSLLFYAILYKQEKVLNYLLKVCPQLGLVCSCLIIRVAVVES